MSGQCSHESFLTKVVIHFLERGKVVHEHEYELVRQAPAN